MQLTEQDIHDYLTGTSLRKLAQRHGTNHHAVHRMLTQQGITTRTKLEQAASVRQTLTQEQIDAYLRGEVSSYTLADVLNIDHKTVVSDLKRMGVSVKKRGRSVPTELIDAYVSGLAIRKLVPMFNRSEMSIRRALLRQGVQLRDEDMQRKVLSASRQGLTLAEWKNFTDRKFHCTFEYKQWRNAILLRDQYTCQWCNKVYNSEKGLHSHHIYLFSRYPEKALDLDNGITLCNTCHHATYGKEELLVPVFLAIRK